MPTESSSGRESALQRGWTVESKPDLSSAPGKAPVLTTETQAPVRAAGSEGEVQAPRSEGIPERAQLGNLTVVMLGLTGGIYMLYAWVWLSWAQYYSVVNAAVVEGSGSIGGVLQQIVYWIAPLAPILWCVAAIIMHKQNPKKLALALGIGLIVLLPLPMIFASGAAL